jgi:hypothetical protein
MPIEIISPDIAFFCVVKPQHQLGRSEPLTKLYAVISQETLIWIFTAMKKGKTYVISGDFQFQIYKLERQIAPRTYTKLLLPLYAAIKDTSCSSRMMSV